MSAADPYQQALLELARAAHGAGTLDAPSGTASGDSPLCGDRVRMQVELDGGCIRSIGHEVKGCLLSQAAASLLGQRAIGLDLPGLKAARARTAELLAADAAVPAGWPELELFTPVRPLRNRHGCVLLPFDTLIAAIEQSAEGKTP